MWDDVPVTSLVWPPEVASRVKGIYIFIYAGVSTARTWWWRGCTGIAKEGTDTDTIGFRTATDLQQGPRFAIHYAAACYNRTQYLINPLKKKKREEIRLYAFDRYLIKQVNKKRVLTQVHALNKTDK